MVLDTLTYTVKVDCERCKGCEFCVNVCPRQVLGMTERLNACGHHFAVVLHQEDCIGCLQCSDMCPDAAIMITQRKG
ncbi:MAG: 4Fe-4S dicluster domain-containing protein [Kiritimatiellia bacterium]